MARPDTPPALDPAGERIPLFPLHSVLFPGGPLALRIFEPRYLDMISRCLKNNGGFGVVLIREGREVGEAALTYSVGTFGHISYWQQRSDGLLGVTLRGQQRFQIQSVYPQADQLLMADVLPLPNEAALALPAEYASLAATLEEIFTHLDHPYLTLPREFDNAAWVSARLTELLPLSLVQKQHFLELNDSLERLALLRGMLESEAQG